MVPKAIVAQTKPGKRLQRESYLALGMVESLLKKIFLISADVHKWQYGKRVDRSPVRGGRFLYGSNPPACERNKYDSFFKLVWPVSQTELLSLRSQDDLRWGGWYSRHNGEITYWGDHIVGRFGEWLPVSLLLILATGLIVVFVKHNPAAFAAPVPEAAQLARGKRKRKSSSR